MALTLDQYVSYLDTRDIVFPEVPAIERPKAKPHLVRLPGVRAVLWNVYGTLLRIAGGELYFEHPNDFIMDVALDKTIQEFKMWGSMTRKPGLPADYLRSIYKDLIGEQRTLVGQVEKYPEVSVEKVWEAFIKKLLQKDYKFDAGFYGALNEFGRKVAYFFHANMQGVACYPDAATSLRRVVDKGLVQGLLADGQCFTRSQLRHSLTKQDKGADIDQLLPEEFCFLSGEVRARKPSERLFRIALDRLAEQDITPDQVLHVGSRLSLDLIPARKLGMRTALFAGDKNAVQVDPKLLKETNTRPHVLLTELNQIHEIIG